MIKVVLYDGISHDEFIESNITKRVAARALIKKENKYAVLYSRKDDVHITPGGGVESGESLEEACIREALEETGIRVKPLERFAQITFIYPEVYGEHNYFVCEYISEGHETDFTEQEKMADLELKWLTIDEIICVYTTSKNNNRKWINWNRQEFMAISELSKLYL